MLKDIGRTKKTTLIMVVNLCTTLITSLFSLVINKRILAALGSDYNGVNSTAAQILTILSLIEGGFTLAAQVALYKPVAQGDNKKVSQLISYTGKKMRFFSMWTFLAGIVISIVYGGLMKSSLDYITIVCVMIIAVIGAAFNLGIVSQYRILFQVTQTEYKCGYINIISQFVLYFAVCMALNYTDNIVAVRIIYLLVDVFKGFSIALLAKKSFKQINYHVSSISEIKLKGTKEVFVGKITSLIYNSAPVMFISSFIGTASTSVYAIYLSITNVILSILTSVANAPTHGLGQLVSESVDNDKHKQLIDVYSEYELLVTMANVFLCSVTFVLLTPFIRLYTQGVTDINYVDIFFSIVMVLILLIQILHMPSGICLNVAGRFKAMRNIQILASIVLIISLVIGVVIGGLKGLLLGKLFSAIVLAIGEVVYNYTKVVKYSLLFFVRIIITNYISTAVLCFFELIIISNYININSWSACVILGGAVCLINAIWILCINFVFNRLIMRKIINRFTCKIK